MDSPTEKIEFTRSGDCNCDRCGKRYSEHPHCWNAGVCLDGKPTLRAICNGSLVKL